MHKMSRNALTLVAGLIALALPGQQAQAGLAQVLSETGKIFLSVDGLGTTVGTGTIDVLKPSAGATVRTARFACATVPGSPAIPDGGVTIDGGFGPVGVTWSTTVAGPIGITNQLADVTAQMAGILDPAAAGLTPFTIVELSPLDIDGCLLAVIFDDPLETLNHTAILLFGAQSTTGDTFNIALGTPIDLSNPNLVLDFGLAISFGAQDQPPTLGGSNLCGQDSPMNSLVDVNGVRLTSCAGNLDDADPTEVAANGNLFTVGGLGDSNANPVSPLLSAPQPLLLSFVEDELYDLIPFVSDGDTTITVFTSNPTLDDNILFAHLFTIGSSAEADQIVKDCTFNLANLRAALNLGVNFSGPVDVSHFVAYVGKNPNQGNPAIGGGFTGPIHCTNEDQARIDTTETAAIPNLTDHGTAPGDTVDILDVQQVFHLQYELTSGPRVGETETRLCHTVDVSTDCSIVTE